MFSPPHPSPSCKHFHRMDIPFDSDYFDIRANILTYICWPNSQVYGFAGRINKHLPSKHAQVIPSRFFLKKFSAKKIKVEMLNICI